MKKVKDEKCLNCGASIKYNPVKEKFICEYCRSEFTIEDMKKNEKKVEKNKDLVIEKKEFSKLEDMNSYHCENCGATIVSKDNISSTTCIYCKSSAIIKNRLSGIYKPDSIITFKYTKDDAISEFKKLCKGRLLLPKNFNDVKNIESMEGLYVPFWLYDLENTATLLCDCTRVTTWSDARNIYTKTDYYDVLRGGVLTFLNVPNDASLRFDDKIMNAIEPFDYSKLKDFDMGYLAGFLSEKYDVSKDDAYKNALIRIKEDSKNYLKSKMNSYATSIEKENTNDVKIQNIKYVLLPVWVLNIKYNDKIYHFAMNGESGKIVGEIPVSPLKLILLIMITFFLTFIVLLGFFLVIGYRW